MFVNFNSRHCKSWPSVKQTLTLMFNLWRKHVSFVQIQFWFWSKESFIKKPMAILKNTFKNKIHLSLYVRYYIICVEEKRWNIYLMSFYNCFIWRLLTWSTKDDQLGYLVRSPIFVADQLSMANFLWHVILTLIKLHLLWSIQ